MNPKQTVSFNIMADTRVPDGYLAALQNGIKFIFDNYFTNTNYELPESITRIYPLYNLRKFIYKTFYKNKKIPKYHKFVDYFICHENIFNIFFLKDGIIFNGNLGRRSIISDSGLPYVNKISLPFKKILNICSNPYSAVENIIRHELLHCHPMFDLTIVFPEDHCPNGNCLMHHKTDYYNLSKPYDLCDSCKRKIKSFKISKNTLRQKIKYGIHTKDKNVINNILNLYTKIRPLEK